MGRLRRNTCMLASAGADGSWACTALEATHDYALILDREARIAAVNAALAGLFGKSSEALCGTVVYEHLEAEMAGRLRPVIEQALAGGRPGEWRETSGGGRVYDIRIQPVKDEDGKAAGLFAFFRDATQEVRAERERQLMTAAIEQAAEAVIISDARQKIVYVNQAFEAITGFAGHEVRGLSLEVLYRGERQREYFRRLTAALARGDVWTGRMENTRKDGTNFQCDKTVSPVRERGGGIVAYVSVWRDATEVAALEKQIRQAQKLEALGALAGGIAHDFNNMLGPIVLQAEIGLEKMGRSNPARKNLEGILRSAARAMRLAEQILNLGRHGESEEPIPFRVSTLLKECLKLLRPLVTPEIEIHHDVRTERDHIHADPVQIHQVLMNLATNAVHALQGKGALEFLVDAKRLTRTSPVALGKLPPGDYVSISVSDTGAGIDEHLLERIFDPFFTTKKGLGTGLGLSVVLGILQGLGGGVRVRSRPGQGSTFEVLVPASATLPQDLRPLDQREAPEQGMEVILLVEDDPELSEACAKGLHQLGYKVVACRNGLEALGTFLAHPVRFDAVLADIILPGISGVDLIKRILDVRCGVPALLYSGGREALHQARIELGDRCVLLTKPFHLNEIAHRLRTLLDTAQARRTAEVGIGEADG
jgi:PAS domain S-box-containing protein